MREEWEQRLRELEQTIVFAEAQRDAWDKEIQAYHDENAVLRQRAEQAEAQAAAYQKIVDCSLKMRQDEIAFYAAIERNGNEYLEEEAWALGKQSELSQIAWRNAVDAYRAADEKRPSST